MSKHFIGFLLFLTLSGCSGMTGYLKNVISDPRNEKLVYKTDEDYSSRQIDLVVPPNLNMPKTIDALMLPEVIDNNSNKLFTIDTKLDGIKIYKQSIFVVFSRSDCIARFDLKGKEQERYYISKLSKSYDNAIHHCNDIDFRM